MLHIIYWCIQGNRNLMTQNWPEYIFKVFPLFYNNTKCRSFCIVYTIGSYYIIMSIIRISFSHTGIVNRDDTIRVSFDFEVRL